MSAATRVLVIEDGESYDVLEVIEANDKVLRVRAPFLFEVGEQLNLRIEHDGHTRAALVRVRSHSGTEPITELEVIELNDAPGQVSR
jgi:hypothetical protein